MREDSLNKWLIVAVALHVFLIAGLSIPIKSSHKKIDLSDSISTTLVGDIGGGGAQPKAAEPAPAVEAPKPTPPAKTEPKKAKTIPAQKETPKSTTKERTLNPVKKKDGPDTAKEDVKMLDKRIREMQSEQSVSDKINAMRKKVQYMDVAAGTGKGSGSPGIPGRGGSTALDPALARYYQEVWEKIQSAWSTPYSAKKDLLTIVTITIRKDGRISDWQMEQRSGNRPYDEAVSRALKSIDKLPPIPASLNADSVELGFRFLPGAGLR